MIFIFIFHFLFKRIYQASISNQQTNKSHIVRMKASIVMIVATLLVALVVPVDSCVGKGGSCRTIANKCCEGTYCNYQLKCIRGRTFLMGNTRPECFSQKGQKFWDPLFFQIKFWDPLFFPYKFDTPYFTQKLGLSAFWFLKLRRFLRYLDL